LILEIKSPKGKYQLDFYTFSKKVLGYSLLEKKVHQTWCQELDKRRHRVLTLEPRHTYKTTVYMKSYPIWRLFENTNLRILLASAVSENVQNFLSEISGHYLRNDRLIELYQAKYHKRPLSPLAEKKKKITLSTRTVNHAEPSIAVIGALGNIVSAHYDIIIVDDLCNEEDRESPTIREKKKRWFKSLFSVLSPHGEMILIGTRWHFDDAYGYIEKKLNPALPPEFKFKTRIESCYLEDGITPRFPNILSKKRLDALKIEAGPLLFACNYLNTPMSEEAQIFHLEDMVTMSKKDVDLSRVKAIGFCDPSKGASDFSCIITLLLLEDNSWLVFSCYQSLAPHSKLIRQIVKNHAFHKYQVMGIEANEIKAKADKVTSPFEHVLKEEQDKEHVTVPYKLFWHTTPKIARIKSIEPYYVNGQLKFLDTWNQDYPDLIAQLVQFPLATHDDGPDTLAGAIETILDRPVEQPVLIPRAQ
jgi:predicted phage terminase large subunit-like protein